MKRVSGFEFRRSVCAILAACYGILAVIATAPHRHDWSPLSLGTADAGELHSAAVAPASTNVPQEQTVSGVCRLCAWGGSSARICPVFSPLAGIEPTASARPERRTRATDAPREGNVLLRAPPAA